MKHIAATLHQHLRRAAHWLARQSATGNYWQPRCYTGDPNWHTPLSLPRRPAAGQPRRTRSFRSGDTCPNV